MIRQGDTVKILTGKDRGKTGKIQRILVNKDRAVVEKLNLVKRHSRPTEKMPQGGIIEKEASIHVSNLLLFCEKCQKPTRRRRKLEKDKKIRVCVRCGEKVGV
jgi:large subunit ribosomal protein L24